MKIQKRNRAGFAWLEFLLALALLALIFQLRNCPLWALDVRKWPRTFWFAATWIALLPLLVIRFGPDLYLEWQLRQERNASVRAKKQKQQELKEQREMLGRMKEAMKRRVY